MHPDCWAEPAVNVHKHEIVVSYLADTSTYHCHQHQPVPQMKSEIGTVECWDLQTKAFQLLDLVPSIVSST